MNKIMFLKLFILLILTISIVSSVISLTKDSPPSPSGPSPSPSPSGPSPSGPSPTPPSPPGSGPYSRKKFWKGKEIIPENSNNGWEYVTGRDITTHGGVTYVGTPDSDVNFAGSDENQLSIIITQVPNEYTNSIRLRTSDTYDTGIFIMDVAQIPFGKYIWPSWWLLGDWPDGNAWSFNGEIDIIEGGWQPGGGGEIGRAHV